MVRPQCRKAGFGNWQQSNLVIHLVGRIPVPGVQSVADH
jgi:hypothetical protein